MTLQDYTNLSQITGTLLAVLALGYTAYQIRISSRISAAQFWLELRKMFSEHQAVHLKLRPGGEWANHGNGPSTPSEWAAVEAYMGLFEHCERMLAQNLIDHQTFRAVYAYRMHNICNNQVIVNAKLQMEHAEWKDFISLLKRLEISS